MDSSRSERMKPLSIADYLDHLGRAAGRKGAAATRELAVSPSKPAERRRTASRVRGRPSTRWRRRGNASQGAVLGARHGSESRFRSLPRRGRRRRRGEAVKLEDIAVRLAEAYARGRDEGLAEGRAEAADRHAAELAAARRGGGDRAARVSAQRIRSARERDPLRIERDRGQCRSGRHPHPRAVSG